MAEHNKRILELNGLRGIAILWVLLFHFLPEQFRGGFRGVDIFFTLSGFLVTLSVLKYNWTTIPNFLSVFYTRRFARIFPMTFTSALLACLISFFFVSPESTFKHFTFSLLGLENLYLFSENLNYFATKQEFIFFTQYWSLGIEEQFYIFFSVLIITFRKSKYFKTSVIFITATSLFAAIYNQYITKDLSSFFYLPHLRLWQLSIGSLGAIIVLEKRNEKSSRNLTGALLILESIGVAWVFIALFLNNSIKHTPFSYTILLTLSTLLICYLSSKGKLYSKKLFNIMPLQFLGDISFSLYLIHWIILVLFKHVLGPLSTLTSIFGIIISIIFSFFAYRFIEYPTQRFLRQSPYTCLKSFLLFSVSLIFLFVITDKMNVLPRKPFLHKLIMSKNELSPTPKMDFKGCHGMNDELDETRIENCLGKAIKGKTNIFINGDSHAVRFKWLSESNLFNTKFNIRAVNLVSKNDFYSFIKWRSSELTQSPKVLEYMEKNLNPGDWIFLTYAGYRKFFHVDGLQAHGSKLLSNFFKRLEQKKIKILLILDNPIFSKDIPVSACLIQSKLFQIRTNCNISKPNALDQIREQRTFFKNFKKNHSNVFIFDMLPFFCNKIECSIISKEGTLLFMDNHHITKHAILSIAPQIHKLITNMNQ